MCTGTTYAHGSGTRTGLALLKTVLKRMFSSGPICSYFVMLALSILGLTFPKTIVDWAQIGANANAFLAMILLGQSIRFSMPADQLKQHKRLM